MVHGMNTAMKIMTVSSLSAALLVPMSPVMAAPAHAAAPAKISVAAAKKSVSKYTTTTLNLRKSATTSSKRLLTIPKSKKVTVKSTKGSWSQVTYAGKTGWASSKYLTSALPKVTSKSKSTVKKKTNTLASKARAFANKYGCKNAGISWNDKLLGKNANGTADWYTNRILLRSSMPAYRLEYVTAHECMHLRQYKVYKGDVRGMARAANKLYGRTGTSYYGLERVTDCMTKAKGIKVYNYTNKCTGKVAKAAKNLLNGKKI